MKTEFSTNEYGEYLMRWVESDSITIYFGNSFSKRFSTDPGSEEGLLILGLDTIEKSVSLECPELSIEELVFYLTNFKERKTIYFSSKEKDSCIITGELKYKGVTGSVENLKSTCTFQFLINKAKITFDSGESEISFPIIL